MEKFFLWLIDQIVKLAPDKVKQYLFDKSKNIFLKLYDHAFILIVFFGIVGSISYSHFVLQSKLSLQGNRIENLEKENQIIKNSAKKEFHRTRLEIKKINENEIKNSDDISKGKKGIKFQFTWGLKKKKEIDEELNKSLETLDKTLDDLLGPSTKEKKLSKKRNIYLPEPIEIPEDIKREFDKKYPKIANMKPEKGTPLNLPPGTSLVYKAIENGNFETYITPETQDYLDPSTL